MIAGPLGFYTVGKTLIDALAPAIGGMNRVGMVPGAIAWDDCECGSLTGSVGRMWMTENFPEERVSANCKAGFLAGEILIQVLRCSPTMTDTEVAPTAAELDASAREVNADAWRLLETTHCTLVGLVDTYEIIDFTLRPLIHAGPMGLCVGPQMMAIVCLNHGVDT